MFRVAKAAAARVTDLSRQKGDGDMSCLKKSVLKGGSFSLESTRGLTNKPFK
jgi:hypothetical protein